MRYIEIDKELVPYSFEIMLEQEMYVMEVLYNERVGLFTITLYDNEENVLVYDEPLIYGQELFSSVRNLDFPIVRLVPLDPANVETEVTFDNLNETVFLTVNYEEEEE